MIPFKYGTVVSGKDFCGDSISEDRLSEALELIFSREAKFYELILSELTALQLKCLSGLAKSGGTSPTSSSFLALTGINQLSSVTKALSRLLKLKIIFRTDNEYRLVNPLFLRPGLIIRIYGRRVKE